MKRWLLETYAWFAVLLFGFFLMTYASALLFLYDIRRHPPVTTPEVFTYEQAMSAPVTVTLSDWDLYLFRGHTPEEFEANRTYLHRIAKTSHERNIGRVMRQCLVIIVLSLAVIFTHGRIIRRVRRERLRAKIPG